METRIILQGTPTRSLVTFADELGKSFNSGRYDSVGIAAAYATVAGIRLLLNRLGPERLARSKWLFGLDDYFTQPSAIELARTLTASEVRVASFTRRGFRFHPKLYWFGAESKAPLPTLMIGSPNLTRHALLQNVEASILCRARSSQEAALLNRRWNAIWSIGRVMTPAELTKYREQFEQHLTVRRSLPPTAEEVESREDEVLRRDSALVDPATATICWIEVGRITGFQAEQLEIKAEQALFFGLPAHGGPDSSVDVTLTDGSVVSVPVKYYGNAMWRFNLPQDIPEVARGLRPGGRRSHYVAVFTRQPASGSILLEFISDTSRRYRQLVSRSQALGTIGSTSARRYGWL